MTTLTHFIRPLLTVFKPSSGRLYTTRRNLNPTGPNQLAKNHPKPKLEAERYEVNASKYHKEALEVERLQRETRLAASISAFTRQIARRKANMLREPLIYEGPINVKYWIRRRRSGARK